MCPPNSLPLLQRQEAVSDPPLPSCSISFSTKTGRLLPCHATCGVGWVLSPASSEQRVTNMRQRRSPDRAPWDVQTLEVGQPGAMPGTVLDLSQQPVGHWSCVWSAPLWPTCSADSAQRRPRPASPFQNWDSAFGPQAGPWRAHGLFCTPPILIHYLLVFSAAVLFLFSLKPR